MIAGAVIALIVADGADHGVVTESTGELCHVL
jgi:hypothetical protein